MDYNSHHSLHYNTHISIHHCTNYTAVTNQPWLSCHTCTSFTHPHISSTLPYTRCEVLFCPGWHSERFPCILFPWTAYMTLTICCLPSWPCLACDILSVCHLPRPLHCPCCWFCHAYVTPVIASDPCLFDLALLFNKAAFESNDTASSLQSYMALFKFNNNNSNYKYYCYFYYLSHLHSCTVCIFFCLCIGNHFYI